MVKDYKDLLSKVEKATKGDGIDLSADEDLSIAIMNLISIEEHLFFTSQKTDKPQYLDILNEVRVMRADLLKRIIKDYEGEVWCISKHLLAASMRVMEVGTKAQGQGKKDEAQEMFKKAYELYSLFWGINLKLVDLGEVKKIEDDQIGKNDKEPSFAKASEGKAGIMGKLGKVVQYVINCCKE